MGKKKLQLVSTPLYQIHEDVLKKYQCLERILEQAGLGNYAKISWPDPDLDLVQQFVVASQFGKKAEVQLNSSLIRLEPEVVSRVLKIHTGGVKLSEIPAMTGAVKIEIFGMIGEGARTVNGWPLLTIKTHELAAWTIFLNQRLFLAHNAEFAEDEVIMACYLAWTGIQIDWSEVVCERIKKELQHKKKRNPLVLTSATLISAICKASQEEVSPGISRPLSASQISVEPNDLEYKAPVKYDRPVSVKSADKGKATDKTGEEDLYQTLMQEFKTLEIKTQSDQKEIQVLKENETTLRNKMAQIILERDNLVKVCRSTREEASRIRQEHVNSMRFQAENQKKMESFREAATIMRKDKEKIEAELTKLKEQHRIAMSRIDHMAEGDSSQSSGAGEEKIRSLESDVRLLALSNEELQQESEKADELARSLRQAMWTQQRDLPPSFSLFRSYALQSDVCLTILELRKGQVVSRNQFEEMWEMAEQFDNLQNLICEMLVQGDLELEDWTLLLHPIADVGVRALLYYMNLERQLRIRRQIDWEAVTGRKIRIGDHRADIAKAVEEPELRICWAGEMSKLLSQFNPNNPSSIASIREVLTSCLHREAFAKRGEFTNSHYAFAIQHTGERLQRAVDEMNKGRLTMPDAKLSALINLPPKTYVPAKILKIATPIQGSKATCHFLGQYHKMFAKFDKERPIPSWDALRWLIEDYGDSVEENVPWDREYACISATWQMEPPAAVVTNGHFCPCPRRFKWNPAAVIDTVEYNWPKIPGEFNTPEQCAESYHLFHEQHITHTDPVCFRAAVFSDFLRDMCENHKVIINVNKFDKKRPEFHILMKIKCQGARSHRLVEVMAITHFLYGAHLSITNEFSTTRHTATNKWLESQRNNNLELLERDDDVKKELDKLDKKRKARWDSNRNIRQRFD